MDEGCETTKKPFRHGFHNAVAHTVKLNVRSPYTKTVITMVKKHKVITKKLISSYIKYVIYLVKYMLNNKK